MLDDDQIVSLFDEEYRARPLPATLPKAYDPSGPKATLDCRSCGTRIVIAVDAVAPLCQRCSRDLPGVLERLYGRWCDLNHQLATLVQAFEDFLAAQPAEHQTRFSKVLDARLIHRGGPHEATLLQREREAIERNDPLSWILIKEHELNRQINKLDDQIKRVRQAIDDIRVDERVATWQMSDKLHQRWQLLGVKHVRSVSL